MNIHAHTPMYISLYVYQALERKDRDRDALLRLLSAAGAGSQGAPEGEGGLISLQDMAQGCSDLANLLPDLEIDIPLASKHAAKVSSVLLLYTHASSDNLPSVVSCIVYVDRSCYRVLLVVASPVAAYQVL
jgi:hypothetical protein